jgi:uncharacterized protein DUF2764
MKLCSNTYHMLISSLPPLPPRFETDRLPISLERLQNRLRMLEPEDAEEIGRMFEVLRWSRQFEESNDAAVAKHYAELMQGVTNRLIREVLTVVMDARLITTALRRRRRGLGPPEIGIGRWLEHIRRHFNEPDLGLGYVFPRLAEYERMLEQGDVLNVYRGLLQATWAYLKRRADDYYFSFEAVVLYVARWNIMRQWQELEAERGRPIFEALVAEALGEHANIYS